MGPHYCYYCLPLPAGGGQETKLNLFLHFRHKAAGSDIDVVVVAAPKHYEEEAT